MAYLLGCQTSQVVYGAYDGCHKTFLAMAYLILWRKFSSVSCSTMECNFVSVAARMARFATCFPTGGGGRTLARLLGSRPDYSAARPDARGAVPPSRDTWHQDTREVIRRMRLSTLGVNADAWSACHSVSFVSLSHPVARWSGFALHRAAEAVVARLTSPHRDPCGGHNALQIDRHPQRLRCSHAFDPRRLTQYT